jgi:hypothetical protein
MEVEDGVDGKDMIRSEQYGRDEGLVEAVRQMTGKVRCQFRYESTSFYHFLALSLFVFLRA